MSDAHAAPAASGGGSGGGMLQKILITVGVIIFVFTLVVYSYDIIFSPTNVEMFLSFLYSLEIILLFACVLLGYRFRKFTQDFHHLCHEIDHIYEHKNHPAHKEHIPLENILQRKLDDISEIFKEHDSSLWPANFKSLNALLVEELKTKNIVGETFEEMFIDLLSKGFTKRKELDLLLRVKNKVHVSFFKKIPLEISQLNKVAELYEFVIKEIVNFGDSKEH